MKKDEKNLKKDETKNKKDFDEIGRVERREYDRLKRRAIKFEERNRQYILVIPCDGEMGWCEMSEHSALIYKYMVCLPLGVPVTMTDDFDSFYIQYDIGRIRTRGYETVRNRLKKVGLYKKETKKDRCIIFELKKVLTDKEIDRIKNEESARQLAVNSIVKVDFMDPALYQKMIEVATRLHRVCYRRMDKLSSATNGERMVRLMDDVVRMYYKIAECGKNSPEDLLSYWREMRQIVHQLLIELQIVAGLKLWTRENCMKIGESVLDIQERIDRQIKRGASRLRERNK